MLPAALIIFREMFEIVLIVGIVLAATRGMKGRMPWILIGLGGGLAGSALVAYFTDRISEFAEGLGQELFNAGVLFLAAFFIGWTVLWMSRHAREMKAHFKEVGARIQEGNLPFYALSFVIGIAMLREGSEIVLFSYGMLASGQALSDLLLGALVGGFAGTALGLLIYFGLISLPIKYFLRVTSVLLVLLVAGMMSQGVGFLIAAGYLESLSRMVWDSSWLLTEYSAVGQGLHALIGYTARPAWAQLYIYGATLLFFFILLRANSRKSPVSGAALGKATATMILLFAGMHFGSQVVFG